MKKIIEFGGAKNGFFNRNKFVEKNENYKTSKRNIIKEYNNTDVYKTILEAWEEEDKENTLYGPLYLDVDGNTMTPEAFETVKHDTVLILNFLITRCHIPEEQIRLYFSGSKGFHIIVPAKTLGIQAKKDLNQEYKAFAQYADTFTMHHGIDKRIYDNKRLLRLEGSINSKTGLYKVPVKIEALRSMNHQSMMRYASKPKVIRWGIPEYSERGAMAYNQILEQQKSAKTKAEDIDRTIIFEDGEILPCVQYLLDEGVSEGNRNNTCVAVASALMQNGFKPKDTSEIMLEWNQVNEPPMDETEVLTTVKSAHQLLTQNRGYGCTFFKEAGYCQDECPLLK